MTASTKVPTDLLSLPFFWEEKEFYPPKSQPTHPSDYTMEYPRWSSPQYLEHHRKEVVDLMWNTVLTGEDQNRIVYPDQQGTRVQSLDRLGHGYV